MKMYEVDHIKGRIDKIKSRIDKAKIQVDPKKKSWIDHRITHGILGRFSKTAGTSLDYGARKCVHDTCSRDPNASRNSN